MKTHIVIIGCGPKALAIGLKNKILAEHGWKTPQITILEKNSVGGHWNGKNGFTDGKQTLGISPEKDIGYPYQSSFGKDIDDSMFQYSWNNFLRKNNTYSEWIDRGKKNPTHEQFSQYLQWCAKKIPENIHRGFMQKIQRKDNQWEVFYSQDENQKTILCDGVIFTGPGKQNEIPMPKNHPQIFNGKNFWENTDHFFNLKNKKIGIIGAGETNATILNKLLNLVDHSSTEIEIINRHASVFTRSENYFENRYFSHPDKWKELTERERNEMIFRADRSTFSVQQKDLIDNSYIVKMRSGSAKEIIAQKKSLTLILEHKKTEKHIYDYIITGMGTDNFSFTSFFPEKNIFQNKSVIINDIQDDLSLKNITPKIHAPMISGFAQGIGFPNLSCLGILSDRILSSYCQK